MDGYYNAKLSDYRLRHAHKCSERKYKHKYWGDRGSNALHAMDRYNNAQFANYRERYAYKCIQC